MSYDSYLTKYSLAICDEILVISPGAADCLAGYQGFGS